MKETLQKIREEADRVLASPDCDVEAARVRFLGKKVSLRQFFAAWEHCLPRSARSSVRLQTR